VKLPRVRQHLVRELIRWLSGNTHLKPPG